MQQPSTIQKGQRGAKPHNRCDLPAFSSNRMVYPGMKEELTEDSSRSAAESPSIKNERHIHQPQNDFESENDHLRNADSTSTSNFTTLNHDFSHYDKMSFDRQTYLSSSTGGHQRHSVPRFHSPASLDSKPHRLTPLLLGQSYQKGAEFSPEVKLNLNVLSPIPLEHQSTLKRHLNLTPTNYIGTKFKGDPQNEPEDLSVTTKKKRKSGEGRPPDNEDDGDQKVSVSSEEGGKILPLLINYRKTPTSPDS